MTCFCPEGRNNEIHSWGLHTVCKARPRRLPQTHVYLGQSASVLPATLIRTTVDPEPASSVNPENPSVGKMLLVLYESLHMAIS